MPRSQHSVSTECQHHVETDKHRYAYIPKCGGQQYAVVAGAGAASPVPPGASGRFRRAASLLACGRRRHIRQRLPGALLA